MRKARFVVRFFSHRYRFLKFFVPFSYRPLRRALSYMVPNKRHPTYKKDRFVTLTRSTDKSRFLVLLHAEGSLRSAFFLHRYRSLKFFVPFSYRPLRRALSYMVPNKRHPTYKKDRFVTLMPTRSADKSRFLVLLHAEV